MGVAANLLIIQLPLVKGGFPERKPIQAIKNTARALRHCMVFLVLGSQTFNQSIKKPKLMQLLNKQQTSKLTLAQSMANSELKRFAYVNT